VQKPQDRTIRIPLIGGLGNQLFQFAGGLAIRKSVSAEIHFFDDLIRGSKVLNITPRKVTIENITDNQITSIGKLEVAKMLMKRLVKEGYWLSDSVQKPIDLSQITSKTKVVSGYFQSRHIVDLVIDEIIDAFNKSIDYSKVVPKEQLNQITVHMRLGDKLSRKDLKYFGRTSTDYYLNGINVLSKNDEYDSINIVSDQPDLARKLLEVASPKLKLDFSRGTSEIEDLSLISHSRGIVMSCSSFSWWGARLASINPNTQVIAPSNWLSKPSIFDEYMNLPAWTTLVKD
jgi:hypothetical protein